MQVTIYNAPDPTIPDFRFNHVNLFLAGGISNCPDWQSEVSENLKKRINKIEAQQHLNVFNPRREGFILSDSSVAVEQIEWEHQRLMRCSNVLFWFPCETLCPITLFELGKMLGLGNVNLFIGIHPNYQRKLDVEVQVKLLLPNKKISYSLNDLIDSTVEYISHA